MSLKRTIRYVLYASCCLIALLISRLPAAAQCAMCKNAITGSPDAGRLAANFNFAVLVLLIPPVLIFCGLFVAIFKHRKADTAETGESTRTNSGKRPDCSKPSPTIKLG